MKIRSGSMRPQRPVAAAILAAMITTVLLLAVSDAHAQYAGAHTWRSHWWWRHAEFNMAHSVTTDQVAFDEQGYIDLELSGFHPLAIRDLFPYRWLYRDDQLREMGYSPILFWSIPYYLPSYDEMRRIYTVGGYFFDPYFHLHGGFWERLWLGYMGHFPYDYYWFYWDHYFYNFDFPYGGWWHQGRGVVDRLALQMEKSAVHKKKRSGWPAGPWVREPNPTAAFLNSPAEASMAEKMVETGNWPADSFEQDRRALRRALKMAQAQSDAASGKQAKKKPVPGRDPRNFLPPPGPERTRREPIGTASSASSGSSKPSGSSGAKKKVKKK